MILPQRKNLRLRDFDYSQAGYYFITICTANKRHVFGQIINGTMVLNEFGNVTSSCIEEIPNHIENTIIDKYVVMPNHIHLILIVQDINSSSEEKPLSFIETSKQIVPKAIQQFKASVTRNTKMAGLWQSRYYDHIIRNEPEYLKIWEYIETNPLKWELDTYYHD